MTTCLADRAVLKRVGPCPTLRTRGTSIPMDRALRFRIHRFGFRSYADIQFQIKPVVVMSQFLIRVLKSIRDYGSFYDVSVLQRAA